MDWRVSGANPAVVDGRAAWVAACAALTLLAIANGAPYIAVVALRQLALDLGTPRSVPALLISATYLGMGAGGILMGWWADRVGVRRIVAIGGVMIGGGLVLSSGGALWQLYLGHGVMMGLFG